MGLGTTFSHQLSHQLSFTLPSLKSIFGPARQYLVSDEFANELKDALKNARKLELIKDRGVYWLPIGPTQSDEQTREDANHF